MKITAFYPAIITREASGTLKNLEKLGFRVIHKRNNTVDDGDIEYVLEDAAGKRIDVVQSLTIDEDFYSIRVNVDDFDEAMKVYAEEGYTVFKGPFVLPDSKNVILTSPGKLQVMLMQHIEDKNVLSEDELDQVSGGTYQIKLYDAEKTKVKNTLKSNIQIF